MNTFGFFDALAGGIVTMAFGVISTYGLILSWAFFASFTFKLSALTSPPRSRRHHTDNGEPEFHWRFGMYGFLISMVWLGALMFILQHIPVVNYQIERMWPDD